MQRFIDQTVRAFNAPRFAVVDLTAAALWLMQINAPDAFAQVHASELQVRVLVERAPDALAQVRSVHHPHTDLALLRLFSAHGFSLQRAYRFVQRLFDSLARIVEPATLRAIRERCATLDLLLLEGRLGQAPRRISRGSLTTIGALGGIA